MEMARVFVGNLGPEVPVEELFREFGVYGAINSVGVPTNGSGCAYIDFEFLREAIVAVRALKGKNGWRVELFDPSDVGPDSLYAGFTAYGSGSSCRSRSPDLLPPQKKIKTDDEATELEESVTEVLREFLERYVSRMKILKLKDNEPTELEKSVAQALFDLENTNSELRSYLNGLYIDSAIQYEVSANHKALAIYYPPISREGFHKIEPQLVAQLEKKFPGNAVHLIEKKLVRS